MKEEKEFDEIYGKWVELDEKPIEIKPNERFYPRFSIRDLGDKIKLGKDISAECVICPVEIEKSDEGSNIRFEIKKIKINGK